MYRSRRILALALLACVFGTPPVDAQVEHLTYETNNLAITITGYTGPGGVVIIPDTIHTLPVKVIEDNAFSLQTNVASVTIPTNVTRIGIEAFFGCSSLTNVDLRDGVTTIGAGAFSLCNNLTRIAVPGSVADIGDVAFSECTNLSAIKVDPLNMNYSSQDGVLFDKDRTVLIQCPGGKTGDYAIPNTVTAIGEVAFASCVNLTSVGIPGSVADIGDSAFSHCLRLGAITVDPLNAVYSSLDGVLFNLDRSTLIECPGGKEGAYAIPTTVTRIGNWAFLWCVNLTSVTITTNVTSIGMGAFSSCTNLTSAIIPDSITTIDRWTFSGCAGLASVTIPNGVTNLGALAFQGCVSLTNLTIPASVNSIGTSVFQGCAGLISVTIPDSVEFIGESAFEDCSSLVSVAIPNSVKNIGGRAFLNCTSLTDVSLGSGITSLASSMFLGCSKLLSVEIPYGVTQIGFYAFADCSSLTEATIPSGVTNIQFAAFAVCPSLAGIYFLGSPPEVDFGAFFGSDNATIYYLPATTGWDSTLGDLPTALWKPRIATRDGNLGVEANRFGFTILWSSGRDIAVEVCTNLADQIWLHAQTGRLTNGSFYFSDPQGTSYSTRFYRVRTP